MTAARGELAAELAAAVRGLPGTVTEYLEALAGEPVDAEVMSQRHARAPAENVFGLAAGAGLVRRTALLKGRSSGRAFVYAGSTMAVERLPAAVLRRLEASREPIGRVLVDQGLQLTREPVGGPPDPSPEGARVVAALGGCVLSRRYRIVVGEEIAIDVSEWFLRAAGEALPGRSGS